MRNRGNAGKREPRGQHCSVSFDSPRSEEHTSELQSRSDLVCRLLLEKKNKFINDPATQLTPNTHPVLLCHQWLIRRPPHESCVDNAKHALLLPLRPNKLSHTLSQTHL